MGGLWGTAVQHTCGGRKRGQERGGGLGAPARWFQKPGQCRGSASAATVLLAAAMGSRSGEHQRREQQHRAQRQATGGSREKKCETIPGAAEGAQAQGEAGKKRGAIRETSRRGAGGQGRRAARPPPRFAGKRGARGKQVQLCGSLACAPPARGAVTRSGGVQPAPWAHPPRMGSGKAGSHRPMPAGSTQERPAAGGEGWLGRLTLPLPNPTNNSGQARHRCWLGTRQRPPAPRRHAQRGLGSARGDWRRRSLRKALAMVCAAWHCSGWPATMSTRPPPSPSCGQRAAAERAGLGRPNPSTRQQATEPRGG